MATRREPGQARPPLFSWDNLVKYWQYCRTYGFRSATRFALQRLQKPKGGPPAYTPSPIPLAPTVAAGTVTAIEKTVSAIIPTKNAGEQLRSLIHKLRAQRNVKPVEIIVVDSGSSDSTVQIAESERVKVLKIPPDQFTHAFSRNKGAEIATGEHLLFIVQDALPLTNTWLHEMLTFLDFHGLAAVSCAEYPRTDSDLFYQFLIHAQYGEPGFDFDRVASWDYSCSTYMGLRSKAHLADLAALIRHDVFRKYGYRSAYAEDLDLGIRLIQDKHRLGFLHSKRVLHSHNRPAFYFFKRGYVDVRFLIDIFPNYVYPQIENKERLFSEILTLEKRLAGMAAALDEVTFPAQTERIMELLCAQARGQVQRSGEEPDPELRQILDCMANDVEVRRSPALKGSHMVWPHASQHVERLRVWLSAIYAETDRALADEIAGAIKKIVALHCGTHLGYLFLTRVARGEMDESVRKLDERLTAGV